MKRIVVSRTHRMYRPSQKVLKRARVVIELEDSEGIDPAIRADVGIIAERLALYLETTIGYAPHDLEHRLRQIRDHLIGWYPDISIHR